MYWSHLNRTHANLSQKNWILQTVFFNYLLSCAEFVWNIGWFERKAEHHSRNVVGRRNQRAVPAERALKSLSHIDSSCSIAFETCIIIWKQIQIK